MLIVLQHYVNKYAFIYISVKRPLFSNAKSLKLELLLYMLANMYVHNVDILYACDIIYVENFELHTYNLYFLSSCIQGLAFFFLKKIVVGFLSYFISFNGTILKRVRNKLLINSFIYRGRIRCLIHLNSIGRSALRYAEW